MRIVANAGGLNPAGLAERLREVASGLGLVPARRARRGRRPGRPRGRARPAGQAADRERVPRWRSASPPPSSRAPTSSSPAGSPMRRSWSVPAVAELGWGPTSYDELAGAVVAGHVIECGTQATGGNFSGFTAWREPLGFPIAEVHADGSSVITKHAGTGGVVSVDTVTAQLVYEIQGTTYLGPDVSTHLDTIALSDDGPDRVRISGVRGSAPPETLKVCVNELGGYRNQAELVLVGLDIEEKADWVRAQVTDALSCRPAGRRRVVAGPHRPRGRRHRGGGVVPAAGVRARRGPEPRRQGLHRTAGRAGPGVLPRLHAHRPARPRHAVRRLPRGLRRPVDAVAGKSRSSATATVWRCRRSIRSARLRRGTRGEDTPLPDPRLHSARPPCPGHSLAAAPPPPPGSAGRVPLGRVAHARSGDKGGDANVGVWARDGRSRPGGVAGGLPHARAGQGAAAGGARPRRRGARAAEPRRREHRAARAARRRGGRVVAVRPAGQGGRGVAAVAARRRAGGAAVISTARSTGFWSDEQLALMDSARAFVTAEVVPHLQEWEDAGSVPRELHAKAAKLGFLGLGVPEELGGAGGTFLDALAVTEAFTEAGASSGLLAALFTERHRTAAHRGVGQHRPRRPVRAADAGRRDDRRARRHRAGWRVRRREHPHHRGARWRPLRRQRRQDVHHLGGARRLRHHGRAHRRARPWRRQPARRGEGHARVHRRPVAVEDGLALLGHRRARVRRRAGACRQPRR